MRQIIIGVVWTVIVIAVYLLAGCGEVSVSKDLQSSSLFCVGVCKHTTTAAQVEIERTRGSVK